LSLAVTIKLIEKSGALSAALLRNRGFLVRRLEDGFPEWKAAGLAPESSKLNAAQAAQLRKPASTSLRSGVKKLR